MPAKQPTTSNVSDESESGQSPFYIAASGSPSRPRRTLKHNDCFSVLGNLGAIGWLPKGAESPDGLFSNDTRHLSPLSFLIKGKSPLLRGSTIRDDSLNLSTDLT